MEINDETRRQLVNILEDYLDLMREEDFKPCGKAAVAEILDKCGIPREHPLYEETIQEVTSKAISIWEIEQLVEVLEKGIDEK